MILITITTATLTIIASMLFFALPFILIKFIFFGLLLRFLFRRILGRKYAHHHTCMGHGHMRRKFQDMTEEERNAFFDSMKQQWRTKNPHTDEDGTVKPINK